MQNLNNYFDNIYCLNLDHRKDRWEKCLKKFIKLNIIVERFSAYGSESNIVIKEYQNLISIPKSKRHEKSITSIGAMGCLASHIAIIKDAKKKKYSKILILEDDIIFIKNFLENLENLNKVKNYKLLYLGSSQHSWTSIDLNFAKKNGYYRAYKSQGTFAYAIHESMYDVCLKYFSEYKKPVDYYLTEIQELTKYAYVLYPNLIIADVTDSDIRGPREQEDHSSKLKWDLKNYDI